MNNKVKGTIYTVISSVLFGLMPLMTKTAYKYGTNAYMVSLGRFLFGSILICLICILNKKSLKISKKQFIQLLKLSIPYSFTPIILYNSYNYIDSGLSTILHFSYPVLVVLISLILYKRQITTKQIICEVLCIIGIVILANTYGIQNIEGMLIAIASGLVYATYIVLLENNKLDNLDPMVLSFWVSLFSLGIITLVTLITGNFVITGSKEVLTSFFALGLFATALGLRLFQSGVLLIGSIKASILSTFEPITGIIVGIIVFNESIGIKEVIAIILILMAACLIVIPSKRSEKYERDLHVRKQVNQN